MKLKQMKTLYLLLVIWVLVFLRNSKKFPKQYLNLGIAEQSMTGIAAGLGLDGRPVITYSIGNFPTLRCLEQIRNDAAYHDANLTIVCIGGGFSYGQLGMSHHATEDIAIMGPCQMFRFLFQIQMRRLK